MRLFEIAFDNSALSRLSEETIDIWVKAATHSTDCRLVIPYPVLCEFIDGGSEEHALRGLELLQALAGRLGSRLVVSADLPDILEIEGRGGGVRRTPSVAGREGQAIRAALGPGPVILQGFRNVRRGMKDYLAKDFALAKDKSAKAAVPWDVAKNTQVPAGIVGSLRTNALSSLNPFFDDVIARHGFNPRTLRRHPESYPSAVLYLSYVLLIMVGAAFGTHQPDSRVLRSATPGSWVDAKIAGCAARARFFVSGDREQSQKVTYLAGLFPLPIKVISLEDWLSFSACRP